MCALIKFYTRKHLNYVISSTWIHAIPELYFDNTPATIMQGSLQKLSFLVIDYLWHKWSNAPFIIRGIV